MANTRSGRGYRPGRMVARARNPVAGAFRTWRSRYARRVATRAGMYLAGRAFGPAAPLALSAGRFAGRMVARAYRAYQGRGGGGGGAAAAPVSRRAGRYTTTGSTGSKVKPKKKYTKSQWDKYNKTGVVDVSETIGSITDQNSVYLINEVMNTKDLLFLSMAAMVRKLLEMGGQRITGYNAACVSSDAGGTNNNFYYVDLVRQNSVTGGQDFTSVAILPNMSFGELVNGFLGVVENYSAGYGLTSNDNRWEPLKLTFFQWQGGEQPVNVKSTLLFNETFVSVLAESELKFQNRTKATGGSEDAENVNNNPLIGRAYLFKGVPKPKANTREVQGSNGALYPFERISYPRATSAFGGTGAGIGTDLLEPPQAKLFWNCYKATNLKIEPGQIRNFKEKDYRSTNILKLWRMVRLQQSADAQLFATYSTFKVQMIALEDMINADAAETISIQYEINRTMAAMCTVKQKKYYRTHHRTRF